MTGAEISVVGRGWLGLESRHTPMHMGVLVYCALPSRGGKSFVGKMVESWRASTELHPNWTLRCAGSSPRRSSRWVSDGDIDLDYHLRHVGLPAPGGERELGELISRLHGKALDLGRPPWEITVIDGLYGQRFALYFKVHPALFNSADLMDGLRLLFSEAAQSQAPAPWTHPLRVRSGSSSLLGTWPALLGPLSRRVRDSLFAGLPWAGFRRAPRAALNDRINGLRRFATQVYPHARLHKVADALRCTEEDIVYYLCGSALRRFFREYNALPSAPMVALVADRSRVDGQLCPLLISLGTQHASRRLRLREVRESLRVARGLVHARPAQKASAEAAVEVLPYLLRQAAGIDHRLPPMFNLGMAHFDSSTQPRYLGPAKVESIFPMPMLLQGSALAIASLSYAGHFHIGLCGARDNLPHLQRMAVYMEAALCELETEGLDDE